MTLITNDTNCISMQSVTHRITDSEELCYLPVPKGTIAQGGFEH